MSAENQKRIAMDFIPISQNCHSQQATRGAVPEDVRTFRRFHAARFGKLERVRGTVESFGERYGVVVRGGGDTFPGGGIAQETATGGKETGIVMRKVVNVSFVSVADWNKEWWWCS